MTRPQSQEEENQYWLNRHRAGDKNALTKLCKLNEGFIHSTVNRYRHCYYGDVDDLTNEAWVGFLRGVERYERREGTMFISFVGAYTVGTVLKAVYSNGRFLSRNVMTEDVVDEAIDDGPEAAFEKESLRQGMLAALEGLPKRERDVLKKHFLEGKTQDDIARGMKLHRTRVQQIEQSALNKMREALQ